MLVLQTVLAFIVAIITLSLMLWFSLRYPLVRDTGTFMIGSCSVVETLDTLSHLLLNVLSTLFLGAGNYAMPVLVLDSPRPTYPILLGR